MLGMVSYSRRPKSGQIMCYLNRTYHVLLTPLALCRVRSKLKCPLFIASEMSGFSFGFIHKPVVVAAVGKWESRVLGGISKRGGKVGFGAFPRSVFSTAFFAAFSVEVMAAPWGL